ncbi:MAG TPA: pyrroloquinoline quinone-dependent dehydrogenase [Opitutaceae bacterium]|nr:pyrroloquinoline quinone-dependent dehydrogenase [Opitutaceae bacterium]
MKLPVSLLLVVGCGAGVVASAGAAAEAAVHRPAFQTAGADWPVYFGDTDGSHYSTLTQITPANVAQLQPAWTFHTGDAEANNRSQMQCNPLVIAGVLYGTSPQLKLFALEAGTGRELWRFDPFGTGDVPGGRGLNRGLAWWQEGGERRLMFSAGQFLYAVDPATGRLIESFGNGGRVDLIEGLDRDTRGLYLAANTPGAVFRDLIIVSMRLGEGPAPAAPGHIRAYDVRTGKRRWIFHTIPHPGEKGHETWPADAWQKSGGANCWAGLVIDHERGIAFVPTGSAAFDFWGGDRAGDNLYANCLLALDAATGERKWHFQFVRHDLWDRDPPAAPVLCEIVRGGRKIAAVAQITKSGHVWVFNRETGESLFPWREEPVPASQLEGEKTSPTQPVPLKPAPFARQHFTEAEITTRTPAAHAAVLEKFRAVKPHEPPFDPPSERGSIILPGLDGGAEWGGAAVDPRGVLYVNSNEMAWVLTMVRAKSILGENGPAPGLYTQLCLSCHGAKGEGNAAQNIPGFGNLASKYKPEEIAALLVQPRGVMPSFDFLPPDQREALAAYVLAGNFNATGGNVAAGESAEAVRPRTLYTLNGYKRFLDPDGFPALRPPWGTLNALDLNTGEYLWQKPLGETRDPNGPGLLPTGTENYGGPVVTAGGVLFIAATNDEKFRAFDSRTGGLLWETTLPAGGYATPATYSVGGRQFVVIACGGGKMGTKSGDAYVAFALPLP